MGKYIQPLTMLTCFGVLLLLSCALPVKNPMVNIPREQWITDWLEHPTCQPPCWENITVGTTTITETTSILSNMPGVTTPGPVRNYMGNGRHIMWDFTGSQSGAKALTNEGGSVIDRMYLALDPNQIVRLEEVIQAYGSPDYVLVVGCYNGNWELQCTVHLIYNKGLALELAIQTRHDKVDIAPGSHIDLIQFFPSGIQGYEDILASTMLNFSEALIKWEGYTEYTYTVLQQKP